MPRIPLMNTQVNSPNVPDLGQGPSVARAGQTWDAVARVGAIINDVGNDLMAKRKEAEIKSYTISSKAEIDRRTTEFDTQLKAKYQGKDPTGYASEMNEFLNTMGTEILDNAPSDDARSHFSNVFNEMSNNIGLNAQNEENKNRAYYQGSLIEQSSQKDRALLIQNPNSEKAASFYANTLEGIKGGVGLFWDQPTADKMIKEQAHAYGQSYLEGAIQNKRYGEVVRFADGKDPNGKVLHENLDPTIMQQYKGEALRKMETQAEVSKALLGRRINDITAAIYSGLDVDNDTVVQAKSQINMLKPEERAYAMDDLNVTLAYGIKLKEAKDMKIGDIQKAQAFGIDHGDDTFNLASRLSARSKFEQGLKKIIDQKVNSPGEFYASQDADLRNLSKQALDPANSQAMKDWADTVTTKNKQEGGPGTKVLTPEMSKVYSGMLKSKNPDNVNSVRNALAAGFTGEHFGKVVSEMVDNGHIDQDMALALYMPDDDLRKKAVMNIQNKAEINEAWGSRASKEAKDTMKEMFNDDEIARVKQAIQATTGSGKTLWLSNSMDSTMELHYKAAIKAGSTPAEAKAEALKTITGSFSGVKADKSNVIIPKQFEGERSRIEDFMYSSMKNLHHMDVAVPNEYLSDDTMIGKSTDEIKSKYLEDVSKNGRWISNSNQTGAILTKVNKRGENVPVRDSNGNILERSFSDMRETGLTYDEEMRVYENDRKKLLDERASGVDSQTREGQISMASQSIARLQREKRKF